jgi:hypothetical protein
LGELENHLAAANLLAGYNRAMSGERAGSLGTLDNSRRNKRPDLTFNKVIGSGLPPRLDFHIVLVLVLVLEIFPVSRASRVKNCTGQFCLAGALLSRKPPAI